MDQHVPSTRSTLIVAFAVFGLAVFLRMPSCYESFWLDELHSAWVAWDGLDEVYSRSIIGHQSPIYFYLLWFWKQIVGESEVLLRLSSVLPVALSCSLIAVAVTRWCNRLLAGLTSGVVLALENNSLFFGTELRPYAFVILSASAATASFVKLWSVSSRHEHPRTWSILIASIVAAAIVQPTSLGVLMWLPVTLCLRWFFVDRRGLFRCTPVDGFCILAIAIVGTSLWQTTLQESWEQKSIWAAFGSATDPYQILLTWNWTWLLVVPLAILCVGIAIRLLVTREEIGWQIPNGCIAICLLAIGTTSLYWFCSRLDLASLWHRRYFVAVLPLFACLGGGCVGYLQQSIPRNRIGAIVGGLASVVLIAGLGISQRTLPRLTQYPVALVARGEDWRNAIAWIAANSSDGDLILVDSGLIEGYSWINADLFQAGNELKRDYLTFPARGPYTTGRNLIPIGSDLKFPMEAGLDTVQVSESSFVLTRRSAAKAQNQRPDGRVFDFGNISVIAEQP